LPAPQLNFAQLLNALDSLNHSASRYDRAYNRAVTEGRLANAKSINDRLIQAERALTSAEGPQEQTMVRTHALCAGFLHWLWGEDMPGA
jgi:hypothetical protein